MTILFAELLAPSGSSEDRPRRQPVTDDRYLLLPLSIIGWVSSYCNVSSVTESKPVSMVAKARANRIGMMPM
jgi:hypothetical protein